jgi:hypothetical protein
MLRFDEDTKVTVGAKDFKDLPSTVPDRLRHPFKNIEEALPIVVPISKPKDRPMSVKDKMVSVMTHALAQNKVLEAFSIQDKKPSRKKLNKTFHKYSAVPTGLTTQPTSANESFTIHKTQSSEKLAGPQQFVISRRPSVTQHRRSSSGSPLVIKKRKEEKSSDQIMMVNEVPFNSLSSAWQFIFMSVRHLYKKIIGQIYLKMFSRDAQLRLIQIIEKKKDELALKQMRTLEVRYGKKVLQLFEKPKRFTFMASIDSWRRVRERLDRIFERIYTKYELKKFALSFTWAERLMVHFGHFDIMKLLPALGSDTIVFVERSDMWPIRNLMLYRFLNTVTENLIQKILFYVADKNRTVLKHYKRLQIDKIEDSATKDELLELTNLIHFRGNSQVLSKIKSVPLLSKILDIISDKVRDRMDWQITNLFLAFSFCTYYCMRKNKEKGYVVLTRAYFANKLLTNMYLSTFVKYTCLRDQLNYYLSEEDRRQPERAVFENKSYKDYLAKLVKLQTRLPFVYDCLENSLFPCLTIEELKNIFKTLGKMALDLKDFKSAVMYFENYMYIIDSIDRANIHRLLRLGRSKEEKVNQILQLNKMYMKFNNRILKAYFEIEDYVKCLTLIIANLFIFNNSLHLMNCFDPHSNPSKKPNEILMTDFSHFSKLTHDKHLYKQLMVFYIQEWKVAMDLHAKIWINVSANQHKRDYKHSFFLAFRESIDHVETLRNYTLPNFLAFVGRYTSLPPVLDTADHEGVMSDNLMPQNYYRDLQIDYYFPTYLGDYDKNFIDYKVLECIYMNHENQKKIESLPLAPSGNQQKTIFKDTEAFKCKRVKKLLVSEVDAFYSLGFEDKVLLNHLIRHTLYRCDSSHQIENWSFEGYFKFVLMNSDKETLKTINTEMSNFQKHWRKYQHDKLSELQKLQNKKVVNHADIFRLKVKPQENQDTLNNILSVDTRQLVSKAYKPSRFLRENKGELMEHNLELGAGEYNPGGNVRKYTRRRLRKTKSYDVPSRKIETRVADMMNLRVWMEAFYSMKYVKVERRMKEKREEKIARMKLAMARKGSTNSFIIRAMQDKSSLAHEQVGQGVQTKGAISNSTYLDYSLIDMQSRDYVYHIYFRRKARTTFRFQLGVNDHGFNLSGQLKSAVASSPIEVNYEVPLLEDILRNKEQYIIAFKYVFRSYWPILFEEFRTDYIWQFYNLSKEKVRELLGPEEGAYRLFAQSMGLGFELQYNEYREPFTNLRDLPELKSYVKQDFHSFELLHQNLLLVINMLQSLLIPKSTGYSRLSTTQLRSVISVLNDNNINFGLFFFLARRVEEMKLAYISMRQDYLVQFTPTSETSSLAADMMRVGEANKLLDGPKAEDSSEPWAMMTPVTQNFDHLNTSNHGSLVNVKAKKNFPTKALKSRLDKTKFTTKLKLVSPALSLEIWAREFLELFRLKVLMVQKETKNREDEMLKQGLAETNNYHPLDQIGPETWKKLSLVVYRENCLFVNVGSELYQVEVWLNIKGEDIKANVDEIESILSQHKDLVRTRKEKDRVLILLILIFFERTFTFELKVKHFFHEKVKRYKGAVWAEEREGFEPARKKYIVKRPRFYSETAEQMSFLQFYYLACRAEKNSRSRMWDIRTLASKEETLQRVKNLFDLNFDLDEEISLHGPTLKYIFESVLSNPFSNNTLKLLSKQLLERQNDLLLCFLREKSIYHILHFTQDESRLTRKEISDYTFEYKRLKMVLDCKTKLSQNKLLEILAANADGNKRDKLHIFDRTLALRLQQFLYRMDKEESTSISKMEARTLNKVTGSNIGKKQPKLQLQGDEFADAPGRGRGGMARLNGLSEQEKYVQKMEKMFNPLYDEIVKKELTETVDVDKKLEIFEGDNNYLAKGRLVYANTGVSLGVAIRRYEQLKDRNIDGGYGRFDFEMHKQSLDCSALAWFGLQKHIPFEKSPLKLYLNFSSMQSSLPKTAFLFDLSVKVHFKRGQDRVYITQLDVTVRYPIISLVVKLDHNRRMSHLAFA